MFYLFSKGGKLITKLLYLYAKNKKTRIYILVIIILMTLFSSYNRKDKTRRIYFCFIQSQNPETTN